MSIDPQLLPILACPSPDHAPLRVEDGELVCTFCESRFPVRDGIPALLAAEARPGPHGLGHRAAGPSGPEGPAGP